MIYFFISSCSSKIYESFDQPILIENIFEVNDSIVKKDPVKLLIQPSPINKFFGYPLGLAINNLVSDNPDKKFDDWLYKKENRRIHLEKLLSSKQLNQLKRYNRSFNNFLKGIGQEPIFLSDIDIDENKKRLKQFYDNIGYFDSEVINEIMIDSNQAKIKYKVNKNQRYLLDSIALNIQSKDLSLIHI